MTCWATQGPRGLLSHRTQKPSGSLFPLAQSTRWPYLGPQLRPVTRACTVSDCVVYKGL